MCLDRVSKRKFTDRKKIRVGWKVFLFTDNGDCHFEHQPLPNAHSKIVPIARWLHSSTVRIATFTANYPNGFHIFPHQDDAEEWRKEAFRTKGPCSGYTFRVVKVRYRHVVASGYATDDYIDSLRVHVARHMYVPHA